MPEKNSDPSTGDTNCYSGTFVCDSLGFTDFISGYDVILLLSKANG